MKFFKRQSIIHYNCDTNSELNYQQQKNGSPFNKIVVLLEVSKGMWGLIDTGLYFSKPIP